MTHDPKHPQPVPLRIQRRRVKGWRMPENTVYVGRGSKWGNPYKIGESGIENRDDAVKSFEIMLRDGNPNNYPMDNEIKKELRGANLACWCSLDQPCHADVLLEIANSLSTY